MTTGRINQVTRGYLMFLFNKVMHILYSNSTVLFLISVSEKTVLI